MYINNNYVEEEVQEVAVVRVRIDSSILFDWSTCFLKIL